MQRLADPPRPGHPAAPHQPLDANRRDDAVLRVVVDRENLPRMLMDGEPVGVLLVQGEFAVERKIHFRIASGFNDEERGVFYESTKDRKKHHCDGRIG